MISGYRLMWLMVMFDLPVETKENRRDYRRFVDRLEDDGFERLQYSIYARPCATDENTAVHFGRVVDWLPPSGEVRLLKFTDKQWARMVLFRECSREGVETPPEQFAFFDEDGEVAGIGSSTADMEHRLRVRFAESVPAGPAFVCEETKDSAPTPAEKVLAETLVRLSERAGGRKRASDRKHKTKKPETPSFDFFD